MGFFVCLFVCLLSENSAYGNTHKAMPNVLHMPPHGKDGRVAVL